MDGKSVDGERLQVEPTSKLIGAYSIKRREEVAEDLPRTTSAGLAENTVTGKIKISEVWQMSLQMS